MRSTPHGFTLIEVLVVVAILGVLTTAVALSLHRDPQRETATAAAQLATLLEAAQTEARAGRRQLAWSATSNGYRFWEMENALEREQRWQPITDDEIFHARSLGDGLHIARIDIDGQALPEGGLLVFHRGDPPLFHIALDFSAGPGAPSKPLELRGLPTGRVEIRPAETP